MSEWRRGLERRSAVPVARLAAQPRWLVVVVIAVVLLAGLALAAPGGPVLLLLLAAFLGWLLLLSWPALPPTPRLFRLAVVAALVVVAVTKI